MARKKTSEMAAPESQETTALIPQGALDLLGKGQIRVLDDVVDLAAEISGSLVRGELSTGTAREVRQWAELMYTCIQAQRTDTTGDTNFIGQLIQIAGGEVAVEASRMTIPHVESNGEKPRPQSKAEKTPEIVTSEEQDQHHPILQSSSTEYREPTENIQNTANFLAEALK